MRIRKIFYIVFPFLLLSPAVSFAWHDNWDNYHGSGRDTSYSQDVDDYYSLGYVPREHPVDTVDLTVAGTAHSPVPPPVRQVPGKPDEFIVSFPDNHGRIINVVLKKSGEWFIGPKGEAYPEMPRPWQLRIKYGG